MKTLPTIVNYVQNKTKLKLTNNLNHKKSLIAKLKKYLASKGLFSINSPNPEKLSCGEFEAVN